MFGTAGGSTAMFYENYKSSVSAYHVASSEAQGQESRPTFFMHRRREKTYHIDYAFLSQAQLRGVAVQVGEPHIWLEHSDHMPLIVSIPHVD